MGIQDIRKQLEGQVMTNFDTSMGAFMDRGPTYNVPTPQTVAADQQQAAELQNLLNQLPPGHPERAAVEAQLAQVQDKVSAAQNFFEFDPTTGQQFRDDQRQLVEALQARAAGQAPSAAVLDAQAQGDANMAKALSIAASAQGVSPGLAMRQAQRAQGEMGLQNMQTLAAMRAREQAEAEQALGNVLFQGRGQDVDLQQGITGSRLDAAGMRNDREATFMGAQAADRERKQRRGDMFTGAAFKAGGALIGGSLGGPAGAAAGGAAGETFSV